MKNKIITIFVLLICLLSIQSFVYAEEGNSTDLTWTDFSNATVEIKNYFELYPYISISNITMNDDHDYLYCITTQNTKPITDIENIIHTDIDDKFNFFVGSYFQSGNISKYLELNQDLYLWVLESQLGSGGFKYHYVIEGKELDRPEYPKYSDMFANGCFISQDTTRIIFNTPWDIENTQRKINIKIGKIEDISILNKFKNNENDAFQKLLEYSKTANSIYNNKLSSTKSGNTYDKGYSSDTPLIDFNLLQDKAYYFVYAQLDDETGKYYPVEAITIGQANIVNDSTWMIDFADISWDDLGDINPIHSTTTPSSTDPTLAKTSIPFAGSRLLIIVAIITLVLFAIIGELKYKKYKGIK